ncbi:DNA ligase (NAD(+)) LigA, partial [Halobacteriales archaeon QH_8_67_36]
VVADDEIVRVAGDTGGSRPAGSLDGYTRGGAQDLVERAGGSATSSVSGNTDYLVVGDDAGQRKRDDAEANDVEMLPEDEFVTLLESKGVL